MKRYSWILIVVAIVVVVGAAAVQLTPHRAVKRTCQSSIVITKGKDGLPLECVCEGGMLTSCFGPGP